MLLLSRYIISCYIISPVTFSPVTLSPVTSILPLTSTLPLHHLPLTSSLVTPSLPLYHFAAVIQSYSVFNFASLFYVHTSSFFPTFNSPLIPSQFFDLFSSFLLLSFPTFLIFISSLHRTYLSLHVLFPLPLLPHSNPPLFLNQPLPSQPPPHRKDTSVEEHFGQ